jgi:hypothetical protein
VDPEFQRALIVVLVVGTMVVGVGASLLFLAFRSFGQKKSPVLIGVLLAFVFACCLVLFFLSYQ